MQNKFGYRDGTATWLLVGGAVLLATLIAACSPNQPPQTVAAVPPAPAVAAPAPVGVATADEYVYYPQYEVYFNSRRHEYAYREGNVWVSRPTPPQVSVSVLLGSPSVRMDFHDSPAAHHDSVARSYPKNWAPPGRGRGDQNPRP